MKGLFIPEITAEMFRNGCLESIEVLMAEGEIYDIDYEPERKKGEWIQDRLISTNGGTYGVRRCSNCESYYQDVGYGWNFCPNCGACMRKEVEE